MNLNNSLFRRFPISSWPYLQISYYFFSVSEITPFPGVEDVDKFVSISQQMKIGRCLNWEELEEERLERNDKEEMKMKLGFKSD